MNAFLGPKIQRKEQTLLTNLRQVKSVVLKHVEKQVIVLTTDSKKLDGKFVIPHIAHDVFIADGLMRLNLVEN